MAAQVFLPLPKVMWLDDRDLVHTPMEAVRNCSFDQKMLQVRHLHPAPIVVCRLQQPIVCDCRKKISIGEATYDYATCASRQKLCLKSNI